MFESTLGLVGRPRSGQRKHRQVADLDVAAARFDETSGHVVGLEILGPVDEVEHRLRRCLLGRLPGSLRSKPASEAVDAVQGDRHRRCRLHRSGSSRGQQRGQLTEVAAGPECGEDGRSLIVLSEHFHLTFLDPVHGVGRCAFGDDDLAGGEAEQFGVLCPVFCGRVKAVVEGWIVEEDSLLEVGHL